MESLGYWYFSYGESSCYFRCMEHSKRTSPYPTSSLGLFLTIIFIILRLSAVLVLYVIYSHSYVFLWRNSSSSPPSVFSLLRTWKSCHLSAPHVSWYISDWFSLNNTKHSFTVWVIAQDRLRTRNRFCGWSLIVTHPNCLLCG